MTMTDAMGETSFNISKSGDWNIVAVWGYSLPDTKRADFETIFFSLTLVGF